MLPFGAIASRRVAESAAERSSRFRTPGIWGELRVGTLGSGQGIRDCRAGTEVRRARCFEESIHSSVMIPGCGSRFPVPHFHLHYTYINSLCQEDTMSRPAVLAGAGRIEGGRQ